VIDLLVDASALAAELASPRPPLLIDARWSLAGPPGRLAYDDGHLPGAVFADLDTDLSGRRGGAGRHPLPDTADFEAVMARVKEALGKSQDPQRKQQALSWRVFKGLETGPGGAVIYVWLLDPPVKDVEYVITDILREAFPNEAQDLWAKYTACFLSGQTMLNLQQVVNMSPAIVPK